MTFRSFNLNYRKLIIAPKEYSWIQTQLQRLQDDPMANIKIIKQLCGTLVADSLMQNPNEDVEIVVDYELEPLNWLLVNLPTMSTSN